MSTRRLFFALWLDEATAAQVHRLADELGQRFNGRAMRADSLHLTLAFLGHVDESRLPALIALGQTVAAACPPFVLQLDQLGHWPHNHIVWASCGDVPPALSGLAEDLRRQLDQLGLPIDQRPYFPHLTLVRKVSAAMLDANLAPPIAVPVNLLQLIESRPRPAGGFDYQPLAQWPIGPPD